MLRRIADEVFSAGFLGRARLRARRRRSPWNLVLIPLFLGGAGAAGYAFFTLVWHVHTWIYPAHSGRLRDFWPRGLGFPAFVSSFLLGSDAMWRVARFCLSWLRTVQPSMSGRKMSSEIAVGTCCRASESASLPRMATSPLNPRSRARSSSTRA